MDQWREATELLREIATEGWKLYYAGDDPEVPEIFGAVRRVPKLADVIVIRGFEDSAGFRAAAGTFDSPFTVKTVVWHLEGGVDDVLGALKDLSLNYEGETIHIPEKCLAGKFMRPYRPHWSTRGLGGKVGGLPD